MFSFFFLWFFSTSCGQDELVFPDDDVNNKICGDWYPGYDTEDGGVLNVEYGVRKGDTFPCSVFDPARLNHKDTYINIGEEYLQAKYGIKDTKAIVFIFSAGSCRYCVQYITALMERTEDVEEAGIFLVGLTWRDLRDKSIIYDILEAENVMEYHDNWLVDKWPITNDESLILRSTYDVAFPLTIVVRASDMRVMETDPYAFSSDAFGVQNLISMVESF